MQPRYGLPGMYVTHTDKESQPLSSVLFISREISGDFEYILNTVNNLSPVLNPESFEGNFFVCLFSLFIVRYFKII